MILKFSLLFSVWVHGSTGPAGSFQVNRYRLICSYEGWADSLLPHLSCWYKALPLSVYLRPKFRKSVCEQSIQRAPFHEGRRTHIGGRCIYLFWGFFFIYSHTTLYFHQFIFFSDVDYLELTRKGLKKRILCFYWKLWWLTMNWVAWCLSNGLCKW